MKSRNSGKSKLSGSKMSYIVSPKSDQSTKSKKKESKIEEYLKKENKEIQKLYLKSKSDLYEMKFKNQSLKTKLEKT